MSEDRPARLIDPAWGTSIDHKAEAARPPAAFDRRTYALCRTVCRGEFTGDPQGDAKAAHAAVVTESACSNPRARRGALGSSASAARAHRRLGRTLGPRSPTPRRPVLGPRRPIACHAPAAARRER